MITAISTRLDPYSDWMRRMPCIFDFMGYCARTAVTPFAGEPPGSEE
jgi:hypothetical protein